MADQETAVSEDSPPGEEFATLRELLDALGYDADTDAEVEGLIEEYADTYMDEDLGMNLFVSLREGDDGEGMSLRAKMSFHTEDAVDMWVLDAPFTVSGFNRYLDELDLRVRRLRAIVELPADIDAIEEGGLSIVGALAALFETDEADVLALLGDSWLPMESDVMGNCSIPVRYLLWNDRLVVGLDDEYVHLFAPVIENGDVDAGDVITSLALGDDETMALAQFAGLVQAAAATG